MTSIERKTTEYLRDTVILQKTQKIDINEDAIKIPPIYLYTGRIPIDICEKFFRNKKKQKTVEIDVDAEIENEKEESLTVSVIFGLQVVNLKSQEGVKFESIISDLTSTLFIPSLLEESGKLLVPNDGSLPWIPRDYLAPQIDDSLVVGTIKDIDIYIEEKTKEISDLKQVGEWSKYMEFVEGLWEKTNKTKLFDEFIYNFAHKKELLVLDNSIYLIPDNTINATLYIKKLYEYALTEDQAYNILYKNMISLHKANEQKLIDNQLPQMQDHMGQMTGDFPLSLSQRESINHFLNTNEGDVLAINGPPGTGKTTLLQSIIADLMVKHALEKQEAPLIVASSTNNQAVTNIIESFESTNKEKHSKNLDEHWILNKNSFATYFPSEKKVEKAIEKKYQVSDLKMGYTIANLELEENKKASIKNVLAMCSQLYDKQDLSLQTCINKLHRTLSKFDQNRKEILNLATNINFDISLSSTSVEGNCSKIEGEIEACKNLDNSYKERLHEWESFWKKIVLYRVFKFIPAINKRLIKKIHNFMLIDENFDNADIQLVNIEDYYANRIDENRIKYKGYKDAKKILEMALYYNDYDINIFKSKNSFIDLSLDSLNTLFDTNIRYYEFWLSVHYYECRWLNDEHLVEKNDLFKSKRTIMNDKYKRLCMITPCLVMTLYMLPKNFNTYEGKYLYNFIDLLIVDEAGQVSPEIGLVNFLLAKKALVVGDVNQIEPVWNISRSLDIALSIEKGIADVNSFEKLEELGLSVSESSLMKAANKACLYSKFGKKGLLLTEHRRCYDELISYCNELVYEGTLEPLRGKASNDEKYPFNGTSSLEHKQVSLKKSSRIQTSRFNTSEAQAIKQWLLDNIDKVVKAYPKEEKNTLIGVITPFKAQAEQIKENLKDMPEVSVGTVHTFQGGERRIILFSTVYGSEENCSFIDFKPNLMNVAMSRAKDRFIVFGDIDCLSSSKENPSGLLRQYCNKYNRI